MEINTYCPECENGIFLSAMPPPGPVACRRCGKGREASGNGALDAQGAVVKCGICGCGEFYRQKDFNTKLGLWVTVLIIGIATFFFFREQPAMAFVILVAGAILDLALYFGLGDIVICYDCRTIYRGFPISDMAFGFDLKTHDKYAFKKSKS